MPTHPQVSSQDDCLLAIDPSLRGTGYAVVAQDGRKLRAIEFGTIKNRADLSQSGCLLRIFETVGDLIARHAPLACAIEGVIYVQSYRTAITLGAARAAALLPVARAGLPVHEYAPRRVKQAVVGRGSADKSQVAFMVRALLWLDQTPEPDAADALAIALTHYQAREKGKAL